MTQVRTNQAILRAKLDINALKNIDVVYLTYSEKGLIVRDTSGVYHLDDNNSTSISVKEAVDLIVENAKIMATHNLPSQYDDDTKTLDEAYGLMKTRKDFYNEG